MKKWKLSMKKLLCSISTAALLATAATGVSALSIDADNIENLGGYLAIDRLAAMTFATVPAFGDNVETSATAVYRVLAGAINYNPLNASVAIDASKIALTATDKSAIATTAVGAMVAGLATNGTFGGTDVGLENTQSSAVLAGVMNVAVNAANIDASVKVTATSYDTGLFTKSGADISAQNLNIATTAIGAINNSLTKVGLTAAAAVPR